MSETMKIVSLTANNIKKVRAVYIKPDGNVVTLTGGNEAGKSSVLDSIEWALRGGKSIQDEPLRKGSKEGEIILDLGNYIVKRVFTKKKTYLKVSTPDGSDIKKPQAILDGLVGAVSFDPLYFINQDKKKQAEILFDLIGVDTTAKDVEIKEIREQRTELGRDRDRYKSIIQSKPEKVEPVDAKKLNKELDDAYIANKQRDEQANKVMRLDKSLEDVVYKASRADSYILELRERIQELERKILDIEETKKNLRYEYSEMQKQIKIEGSKLDKMPVQDTRIILDRIQMASEVNRKADAWKEYEKNLTVFREKDAEYNHLTDLISEKEQEKDELLANVKWPLPGLSVTEDGVMYEGVPIEQASDGRKLCIGITIGMALNPKLKVLRLGNASLLDKANMKMLRELVEEKDFQIWVERVEDDDASAIFIEDGMIAERN